MLVLWLTGCAWLQTPEQQVCSKLVSTCSLEKTADTDPYASCVTDLEPLMASQTDEERAQLLTCVGEAQKCGKVQGCLAGAGVKQALGEIEGLIKGIGDAFRKKSE